MYIHDRALRYVNSRRSLRVSQNHRSWANWTVEQSGWSLNASPSNAPPPSFWAHWNRTGYLQTEHVWGYTNTLECKACPEGLKLVLACEHWALIVMTKLNLLRWISSLIPKCSCGNSDDLVMSNHILHSWKGKSLHICPECNLVQLLVHLNAVCLSLMPITLMW